VPYSRSRIAALALALALSCASASAEAKLPPNVVLVTLDTTRADRIGAWGHAGARTPNLDALAVGGLRFARCDAAAPVTLPSHATMLTGLYPPRHGVRDNGTFTLADRHETVAERFAASGRDSAAVVSAVVLAKRHGLDQGFRLYDDDLGAGYAAGTEVAERDAAATTDAALAALATLRPPFLLWVHYYDPHEEYRPPTRFADLATGEHRLYDGEIAFVDEQLGRLRAALPAGTAIVVVGDHGEMLGEHGETSHGLLLAGGARRVPLVVHGPGVPAGESVGCLVRTADVAPTLLALGGLEIPPGLDGRNLLAADRGCGGTAYSESFLPFFAYRWYPLRTLSDGRALYLQAPRPSLYDLERDPGEAHDLAAAEPALAALWRGRLEKLLAAASEPLEPRVEAGSALDAEQRRQLAALGYLGGGGGGAVSAELPDPRSRVDVARRLHAAADGVQRGDCEGVLRELQAIARDDPHNFPALTLAAQCLRDLGRLAEAIALYRRAAAEHPASPIPAANLGALLLDGGELDEGERELRRALVLDPANGASAARLARRLRESGRAAEALAVMDASRAAGDRHPELLLERGATLAEAGQLEAALADFREAARRDPRSETAAENVARALFALGRRREALVAYQSAARLAPSRGDLWKTIGALALELDEPATAREAFAAALRLEHDPAERAALEAVLAGLDG
jgi:arylsulfatase A-like enzyme/Flp pilus assembly protein TadD